MYENLKSKYIYLHYKCKGMPERALRKIPYNRLLRFIDWARKHLFKKPWPDDVTLLEVDLGPSELEDRLRNIHFEGIHLSYKYKGQVVEVRRPELVDEKGDQFELHVRARKNEDRRSEVCMHIEYSRYEHKEEHINSEYIRWLDEDQMQGIIFEGKKAEK